jgi:hypothetical protein
MKNTLKVNITKDSFEFHDALGTQGHSPSNKQEKKDVEHIVEAFNERAN